LKTECPSLLDVPMSDISLHLRFDGETTAAIRGVDFRILPEAWPSAVVDVLPLIHVRAKAPTGMQKGGKKKKTWEDLKREGALLGVQGWTDQVEAGFDKKEAVNGWIES